MIKKLVVQRANLIRNLLDEITNGALRDQRPNKEICQELATEIQGHAATLKELVK